MTDLPAGSNRHKWLGRAKRGAPRRWASASAPPSPSRRSCGRRTRPRTPTPPAVTTPQTSTAPVALMPGQSLAPLVKKVAPAVVNISVTRRGDSDQTADEPGARATIAATAVIGATDATALRRVPAPLPRAARPERARSCRSASARPILPGDRDGDQSERRGNRGDQGDRGQGDRGQGDRGDRVTAAAKIEASAASAAWRWAPASSSIRPATSSPTTTSSAMPTRSR